MERKIIGLGKRTSVVTIPNSWIRNKKLKAGNTLNLQEHGNWLSLSLVGQEIDLKKEEDIIGLDNMINRYIGALYKAGYDKIKLKVTKNQIPKIQSTIEKTCVGFEIIKTTDNEVIIERIAKIEDISIDDFVKRIFFTLQTNAQDLIIALHSKKKEEFIAIANRDNQINKLADTSRRFLNKEQKDPLNYALIEQLENIGDWYKDIAKEALEKPVKISSEELKQVNSLIELLYDLYFAFNLEKLEAFSKKAQAIKDNLVDKRLKLLYTMLFNIHGIILTKRV